MKRFQNDPKPEIFRIEELVIRVRQGDIKLPKFQRPFVWKRPDILNLWDSIYKGYPIGSILLWLTQEPLASEKRIGDLDISIRPDEYPTNYLLDGQQRLSTLCGALYWNGENKNSMWNISFDIEKEEFVFPKEWDKVEFFPLNQLLETSNFLNRCRVFENHPDKGKYFEKAASLLSSVKDYKIAAVTIRNMDIHQVAPIFERINSTGRRLTIYDLMRAATWKDDFDLNNTVEVIRDSLRGKAFERVPETHILRNISASVGHGINKADVETLRFKSADELRAAAEACVQSYQLAVDFLTKELPVSSLAYLPYALQLTHLVEFFRLRPNPTLEQRDKLKTWIWRTSLGMYFRSSNTGQNSADLKIIRAFGNGEIDDLKLDKLVDYKSFVKETFALNKASSKAFALLLADKKPKSLLDGSPINLYQALAVANRHEFHHIFPQAYLKSSGYKQSAIDVHANICLLSRGNNTTISDQRPSVYFKELETQLGSNLESVLSSNYIDNDAYEAALMDDYEFFIGLRSETLLSAARSLIRTEIDTVTGEEVLASAAQSTDDDEGEDNPDSE